MFNVYWSYIKRLEISKDLELIGCISCPVTKSLLILCDPIDCSMPGFPILHYLLEFAQTEKEMATHSSVLAWRIPGGRGAWWAAIYGVAQSQTQLKWLRNSSSSMSIESVMPFNHLILCCPLLLLLSIFPSIRVFSNKSALCIKWPKWSFTFSPSKEHSVLISFRIDWFDLLAVQGSLKSLL